jgi:outer membrane protein TolC
MTRFLCVAGVVIAVLAPPSVAAQEPLTLDHAVTAALAQNASLRATRAGQDEAAARVTVARSGLFPRFSVTESWQRGDQPVFVFSSLLSARRFAATNFAIDALNHPDPIGFFHTTVGVEQLLFDGGRQRAATSLAAQLDEIAHTAVDEAAAGLAVAATQTFGRILAAQAAHQAAEGGLAAAREDLARVERRRYAGMATDAEVLALVVHVADLQQRAIQADGDAGIARAELNRLMGSPIDREFRAVEPPAAVFLDVDANLAVLFAEADAARPEIKRAAASLQIADASRRQARAGLIPQIAAQAAIDVSGTQFNDRASSWLVGGELRWTFSTGGAELAQITGAAASAARARAEADEARAAVHVDVASALFRVETARARQAAGRAAAEQARESHRIIRDRFDAGIAGVGDLLRASTAVLDADANRISALVDGIVSAAMLRRALGRNP